MKKCYKKKKPFESFLVIPYLYLKTEKVLKCVEDLKHFQLVIIDIPQIARGKTVKKKSDM